MVSPLSCHAAQADETATHYASGIRTSNDTKKNGSLANGHAGHKDSSRDRQVPIIDLSQDEDTAAKQVRAACLNTGFFYVSNHGVDERLVERLFEENRKFFALPEVEKRRMLVDKNSRGYTPMCQEALDRDHQTEGDTKEALYFGREISPDSEEARLPQHGPNQWPSEELLPDYRRLTMEYFSAVTALGMRLLRLLALALGMPPEHFHPAFTRPMLAFRPLHYAARRSHPDQGVFGAGAHSDYGMLTLLRTDQQPGLQILSQDQFIDVAPKQGTFIVNLGDMLERWTNGRFKSTVHRVVMDGSTERYSLPFFFEPNFDTVVECLPTCCGPDDPPRYPPTISGPHSLNRYAKGHALHDADVNVEGRPTAV